MDPQTAEAGEVTSLADETVDLSDTITNIGDTTVEDEVLQDDEPTDMPSPPVTDMYTAEDSANDTTTADEHVEETVQKQPNDGQLALANISVDEVANASTDTLTETSTDALTDELGEHAPSLVEPQTIGSTNEEVPVSLSVEPSGSTAPRISSYFDQMSPSDDPFGSIAPIAAVGSAPESKETGSKTTKTGKPKLTLDVTQTLPASFELEEQFSPPISREEMMTEQEEPIFELKSDELLDVQTSEVDRMHDAWIPGDATRRILMQRVTSANVQQLAADKLTRPRVALNGVQADPVLESVYKLRGEQAAHKRNCLNINTVSHDMIGLRQLIEAGCWRSALDLTGIILNLMGHGEANTGSISQITPESMKVWACRVSVLTKLKMYNIVEAECQQFGHLDSPDLYFEYHTSSSKACRRGSIVPFNMRILHCTLAQHLGRQKESLDRLFHVLGTVHKILHNLHTGSAEDGSATVISDASRKASLMLWRRRELQVMYGLATCFTGMKDYRLALQQYEQILTRDSENCAHIYSTMGRLCIQMGAISMATSYFTKSLDSCEDPALKEKLDHMHKGYIALSEGDYMFAPTHFNNAGKVGTTPDVLAKTNAAVSMLYNGELKTAMLILEEMIHTNPECYMQDGILLNLCTLYELEPSMALSKKLNLLLLANEHVGNGFNVNSLKMS